jgi:tetratricopeptide (TPR) repeat protein
MEQYNAAYVIDAGHAPTLAAIGRLAMDSGDWEKARRVFRSLLLQNLDPQSGIRKAEVYFALGEIHERVSEAPKAVGMYERGLELEPQNAHIKEALARARVAR